MSTTLAVARTRVRKMIREETASKWSNARLDELLQDADWAIYRKIASIRNAGYGELAETVTLAADATTFSLTPGTNPTALTKNLKGILFIEHQDTAGNWNLCNELPEADEFRYRSTNVIATVDVPPLYRLRRPSIVFLPAAPAARTLRISYRPLPTAFSGDSSTLDVDDDFVPLVCTRAAIFALADLGESESVLDTAYVALEDEMYADLAHPTAEGRGLMVKETEPSFSF